jgi:Hemerythrin HHE cation binding domain
VQHWLERRTGIAATPRPVERLSSRTVLDEASRPTAPEPGADTSFSPRGLAVGSHLVDVHDHYRTEMAQIREALEQVRGGTRTIGDARAAINAMTIRVNNWALGGMCQLQCRSLTEHHGLESSSIFPYLRETQPSLGPVIDRLDEEHLVIHDLLEAIDAALVHLAQSPLDYEPITEAVDLLSDTIASHFAYEEQELIAPLASHGFYPGQV